MFSINIFWVNQLNGNNNSVSWDYNEDEIRQYICKIPALSIDLSACLMVTYSSSWFFGSLYICIVLCGLKTWLKCRLVSEFSETMITYHHREEMSSLCSSHFLSVTTLRGSVPSAFQ